MTIIVTGAAGFIGFHMSRALTARGEHVIGIDNLDPYYSLDLKRDRLATLAAGDRDGRFGFVETDFADALALDRAIAGIAIDRIVHLGAQPGVRHSVEAPRAFASANLVGHLNMLELARAHGVRHFVYASTSSVYGGNAVPFGADDRVDRPLSLYAATKRADELMTEAYAHLYRLPATGLRFFTVYGEWGRPDMATWLFTEAVLAGTPIALFNGGKLRRDFTHVDDIVAGVLAALDRPPADDGAAKPGGSASPHALYNLGNNRAEPLARFIALIEAAAGRRAILDSRPMQPGDMIETCADIAPARRDLGFDPRVPLDQGIARFVRWYRDYTGL